MSLLNCFVLLLLSHCQWTLGQMKGMCVRNERQCCPERACTCGCNRGWPDSRVSVQGNARYSEHWDSWNTHTGSKRSQDETLLSHLSFSPPLPYQTNPSPPPPPPHHSILRFWFLSLPPPPHTHTQMHTHPHTHTNPNTHANACTHTHTHTHANAYTQTYMRTYARTHTHYTTQTDAALTPKIS